jgi:hypothetical protein
MVFQCLRMWDRAQDGYDDDSEAAERWYDVWEVFFVPVAILPFFYFPFLFAIRRVSLSGWAQRRVPDLLRCLPAVHCLPAICFAVYPAFFYVVFIVLHCMRSTDPDGTCRWASVGRIDVNTRGRELAIVFAIYYVVFLAVIGGHVRRWYLSRHQQVLPISS